MPRARREIQAPKARREKQVQMEALGEWALQRVGWLRYATFLQWQRMPLIEGQCVIIVWVVY